MPKKTKSYIVMEAFPNLAKETMRMTIPFLTTYF